MSYRINRLLALLIAVTFVSSAVAQEKEVAEKTPTPKVQVAILLDNSGSMSGLINQARSELWKIVNEFATAKQDGVAPDLEVALYHYGSPPAKQLVPLTDDLDKVSEAMFGIGIGGGSEYCGQAIDIASKNLKWSKNDRDLKLIFIAGNEPFSQGPVDFRKACKAAIEKGIIVNTIHCGSSLPQDWKEGSLLADGSSFNIDHNKSVAHIPAPQDKEIIELGTRLNRTYVAYGLEGAAQAKNQIAQDNNSSGAGIASAQNRAVTKANRLYRNSSWDLCDAFQDEKVDLAKIDPAQLPENMRKMTPEERKSYVEGKQAERKEIQDKINKLNSDRNAFVTKKRKELAGEADAETLDVALIKTIHEQATKKNFSFENK